MRYECWGGPADGWRGDLQVVSVKLAIPLIHSEGPEWAIYEKWDSDETTILYKFVNCTTGVPE